MYPMRYDTNFAPHVDEDGEFLTLATCKPRIRRTAKKGDWVMGVSAKTMMMFKPGRIVYLMEVTDPPLRLESYWRNPKFRGRLDNTDQPKIPYRKSIDDRRQDLEGKYVLVSEHFYFFGRNAPGLKELGFPEFMPSWRDFKYDFDSDRQSCLVELIKSRYAPGVHGEHVHSTKRTNDIQGVC